MVRGYQAGELFSDERYLVSNVSHSSTKKTRLDGVLVGPDCWHVKIVLKLKVTETVLACSVYQS